MKVRKWMIFLILILSIGLIIVTQRIIDRKLSSEHEIANGELVNRSEQECILTLEADPRWSLLPEFGFSHTISTDFATCGLMRLVPISDGKLTEENLPEFVRLIVDFTNNPSHLAGFTAEDLYPVLEELELLEYYLELLENYM